MLGFMTMPSQKRRIEVENTSKIAQTMTNLVQKSSLKNLKF